MKLHADPQTHLNTVTAYGPGFVEINRIRFSHSVTLGPEHAVQLWPVAGIDELRSEHFAELLATRPDVVIFGTGARQRFPSAQQVAAVRSARIGLETMDTAAACRTYNILMSEGRRVVAAFIVEPAAQANTTIERQA